MPTVNLVAVVAAGVASMVLGWLWFGPLFGKTWMKLSGQKEMGDKDKMTQNFALAFVGALLTSYVLAVFLGLTSMTTVSGALTLAFWAWLGFAVPFTLGKVLWEGKSWNLFFLSATHDLVGFLLIAAVLTYLK